MPGIATNGLSQLANPFTGAELLAVDTQLASGISPQTAYVTLEQLKDFMFGNTAKGTGTSVAGAVTLNAGRGQITSEALTTAAGAVWTLTITNSRIAAADIVLASCRIGGTNTTVGPIVVTTTPAAGSVVINVRNTHASSALNGTIVVDFVVIKAAA